MKAGMKAAFVAVSGQAAMAPGQRTAHTGRPPARSAMPPPQPMTTQQLILSLVLATMVFSVALELRLADFQRVAQTPRAVLAGLTPQFLLLPVATRRP
jgi:hypothetical protein